jgi:hypothetical protein
MFMASNGADSVVLGVENIWGACIAGRFLVNMLAEEAFASWAWELVVCDGRFSGFMNGSRDKCAIVERGVVSLGSFLSSEEAGRRRLARSESIVVQRNVSIPASLSPLGSLAMMSLVGCI